MVISPVEAIAYKMASPPRPLSHPVLHYQLPLSYSKGGQGGMPRAVQQRKRRKASMVATGET